MVASLFVAGLVASPAAVRADGVQLYGQADVFMGVESNTSPARGYKWLVDSGGMSTSYIGVSGSESFGNGTRAVFAIESFLRPDTGASGRFTGDTFFARDAYVGLSGPFGRLTLGRNTTPFFLTTLMHNPFGDSFTVSPMITHTFRDVPTIPGVSNLGVKGDTGFSNSIRYVSPSFSGLKADIVYSAGQERDSGVDRKAGRAIDGALSYGRGPVSMALAYRNINLSTAGDGHKQEAWQIGGSFDISVVKLQAQYQQSAERFNNSASDVDRKTYQLGASIEAGTGKLLFSYALSNISDTRAATSGKRESVSFGYLLPLSKRTDVYSAAYHDALKNPTGNTQTVGTLGLRHRF